ncbi:MAG: 30S ribosomal protein S4 [Akkermansiaceae bacterium]|nr:30S ribosomal protein S4 [Akkermansia sp.]MCD7797848.1 30S ribosomal protein S4 [Akkermansiaceae bacterium]
MARYTGPRAKISRRFGVDLFGNSKSFNRRPFPPGQHGVRAGRRKKSEYGVMLAEKQKLRFQYGILEKQFRKYYAEASRRRGVTGEILLQLLELRLDNVVYRLGYANTRAAARQMVSHGHVHVNGHKVDIPSYACKPGDTVAIASKSGSQSLARHFAELVQGAVVPDWLEGNADTLSGKVSRIPTKEEIAPIVNEQLIVEFYSR